MQCVILVKSIMLTNLVTIKNNAYLGLGRPFFNLNFRFRFKTIKLTVNCVLFLVLMSDTNSTY